MAKKSVVARQKKRETIVAKYQAKRDALKNIVGDRNAPDAERWQAQQQLQKLPRDASPVRLRNRCGQTGRPRGVYSKFGLGRIKLREAVNRGDVPGMVKASW